MTSIDGQPEPDPTDGPEHARLVSPFPRPGALTARVMARLQLAAWRPPEDEDELVELAELPRPWDPAGCTGPLRAELWRWLDQVAVWINTQHLWNVSGPGVPECWSHHPHVVHDLAVVACARYYAALTASPNPLDEWHRYTLPLFLDRLRDRLGEGCPPGRHSSRPREDRDRRLLGEDHRRRQESVFRGDLLAGAVNGSPRHGLRLRLDLS